VVPKWLPSNTKYLLLGIRGRTNVYLWYQNGCLAIKILTGSITELTDESDYLYSSASLGKLALPSHNLMTHTKIYTRVYNA